MRFPSKLPERHRLRQVVGALLQDEIGARPRRQNILMQVLQIDIVPEALGDRARRILADRRIAMEEGLRVLERGFALVRDGEDRPLKRASDVKPGETLRLQFADGNIGAISTGKSSNTNRKSAPAREPGKQGSLF